MSDAEWTELVDRSRLLSVVPIGRADSRHGVRVEFIALERREAGGVLTFVVADEAGRDVGEGPLTESLPVLRITANDGREFDTQLVGGSFLDLSLVRYRAVCRPPLVSGSSLDIVVARFEFGVLADVEGPWSSGEVTMS